MDPGLVGDGPAIDHDRKRLLREHHAGRIARRSAFQQLLKVIGAAEHRHLLTSVVDAPQHRNLSACSWMIAKSRVFAAKGAWLVGTISYSIVRTAPGWMGLLRNGAGTWSNLFAARVPVHIGCIEQSEPVVSVSQLSAVDEVRAHSGKVGSVPPQAIRIICHDPSRVVTICHILYNAVAKSSYEGRCVEKTDRRCSYSTRSFRFCLEESHAHAHPIADQTRLEKASGHGRRHGYEQVGQSLASGSHHDRASRS